MSDIKKDKILNNSYNNLDFMPDYVTPIEVSPRVSHVYEESTTENIEEFRMMEELEIDLYKMFEDSKYYKSFRNTIKKMPKKKEPEVFYYFYNQLDALNKYETVDIVKSLLEFFNINYNLAWENLLTIPIKEAILRVVKRKYGNDKIKYKQLF